MSTTRERARELREQMLDDVERKMARDLQDTRYDAIRPQSRRRALVIGSYALLLVYALANYFDWPLVVLPVLIAWGVTVFLLRMAIRGLTDYPDEVVDERVKAVRGLTYRFAYMGAMTLLSVYLALYIINQLLANAGVVMPMTADQLHDLMFPFFFGCMALPTAIFAWRERLV